MLSFVAVPVVYLLSIPPVAILSTEPWAQPPSWFMTYAKPALLFYDHVQPVQKPLDAYNKWWLDVLR
jgi:hypothetical protein